MDFQENKKRQTAKVLIAESLMTITAILMVVILVFVVSGYWINENFEMARSGMLQISSMPTGATVTIDEDALSQHTNTSRVIPAGEHTVRIEKDGYDSWSKTVTVKDGLLYRLHYPRLFLNERELENVPLEYNAKKVSISPKREYALLIDGTNKWALLNLDEEKNTIKQIDLAVAFSKNVFSREITSIEWNNDQNKVLIGLIAEPEKTDWFLIDLSDVKRSVNISDEFGVGFSQIKMANGSSDVLFALRNGNLQKINLSNKSISAILAENVNNYRSCGDGIIFTAKDQAEKKYVGELKFNKDETKTLLEVDNDNAIAFSSRFYDDDLITILDGDSLKVFKRDNLGEAKLDLKLSFVPDSVKMGHFGEFLVLRKDNQLVTLDMESETLREWTVENQNFGWLDDDMVYAVVDGELIVYDYDGLNRRSVTKDVNEKFPVVVVNDKWLYYMSNDAFVREWLVQK